MQTMQDTSEPSRSCLLFMLSQVFQVAQCVKTKTTQCLWCKDSCSLLATSLLVALSSAAMRKVAAIGSTAEVNILVTSPVTRAMFQERHLSIQAQSLENVKRCVSSNCLLKVQKEVSTRRNQFPTKQNETHAVKGVSKLAHGSGLVMSLLYET